MTNPRLLPHRWRISRYESELRERETPWESWIGRSGLGVAFNGIVLSEEEYLRVENTYIAAAVRFAIDVSASVLRISWLTGQDSNFTLSTDQLVVRSDIAPIVRGNLRGELDCALETSDGSLHISFGYDLYMYVASTLPCEQAVADAVHDGLWVEPGLYHGAWDEDVDEPGSYYLPLSEDEEIPDDQELPE